jgi:hypothetical protein
MACALRKMLFMTIGMILRVTIVSPANYPHLSFLDPFFVKCGQTLPLHCPFNAFENEAPLSIINFTYKVS